MKTATKVAIGIGSIGLIGIAFYAFKKSTVKYITPLEKFTLDAFNPVTQAGAEIKNYLGATYSPENIQYIVNYHTSPAAKSAIYGVYLKQSQWKTNDVVTY